MEWKEYIYVGNLMQLKGKKKKKKVRLLEFVSKNLGCRWSWAWSCLVFMPVPTNTCMMRNKKEWSICFGRCQLYSYSKLTRLLLLLGWRISSSNIAFIFIVSIDQFSCPEHGRHPVIRSSLVLLFKP